MTIAIGHDFLAEIKALFVQILLIAQTAEVLQLGNIRLEGNKIHADASKIGPILLKFQPVAPT